MESVKVKLEPGVKVKMEYGSDDQYLSSLQWTDEEMSALIEAVISDGRFLIPAGVNKHFHMIIIQKRFQSVIKKKVDSKVIWDKLHELYDLEKLDTIVACPFSNEMCEFSLPEGHFSQLIRDRKSQSTSHDKMMDEESRDSGSGRETPPTLPIAKRGAALQSSNKRKYSTSFSDTGSEGGGGGGRKSITGTPASSGQPKTKRRI